MINNLLRQPLLHFLLIGAAFFLIFHFTSSVNINENDLKKVIVDKNSLLTFMQYRSKKFNQEKFEEKLNMYRSTLDRAAIELAKDWRTDRYLRKLEAMLIVMSKEQALIISGTGDVLSPDEGVLSIGSGSNFARSAALALKRHAPHLTAEQMVKEALTIAADICIYTNHNFEILSL